jgi:UDP-N-acetylglucosamine 2-epimerase
MKAAPVIAALARYDHMAQALVHTGHDQHFDTHMSVEAKAEAKGLNLDLDLCQSTTDCTG